MTTQKAVAIRINELLKKENMTRYALCKKIAMPEATLRAILNERYKTVKIDTIILISDAFNMTFQEFFNHKIFSRDNLDID